MSLHEIFDEIFSLTCLENETKVLYSALNLFPIELDQLVLDYANAGSIVAFACYSIPALQIHRVHNMWRTSGGKLVMEAQYDHEQEEGAESCPSSDIYWELKLPTESQSNCIEPFLIQDCGNRGEASVRRMSSGQTLLFYNDRHDYIPEHCWKCRRQTNQEECKKTHSVTYKNIPKVMDLDSNRELNSEEIGHSNYTMANRWMSDYDDDISVTLCTDIFSIEGTRTSLKQITLPFLQKNLCQHPSIHGRGMGLIRDRCFRDGSVVAVLAGHQMVKGIHLRSPTNRIPCSVGIWTKKDDGKSFHLHPSLDFSVENDQSDYMGFLHFLSSEYLLVSILESLNEGWFLRCSLIYIQSQQSQVIQQRSLTLVMDRKSWRLDALHATGKWTKEEAPHELEIFILFTQQTAEATRSSGLVRMNLNFSEKHVVQARKRKCMQ